MSNNIVCYRLRGFNFPAVNIHTARIEKLVRTANADALIIDMHGVRICDFTAVQGIGNIAEGGKLGGFRMCVSPRYRCLRPFIGCMQTQYAHARTHLPC